MPILSLIMSNKRWSLIAVLVAVLLGQLACTNHLAGKLKKANDKCTTEKQAIIDSHKKATDKASADLIAMSEKYEKERLKEKVIYNEQKTELKEIIKSNPVYIDCKLDSGVYEKLRQATITK